MHEFLLPCSLIILAGVGFRHLRTGRDADALRQAITMIAFNIFQTSLRFRIIYHSRFDLETIIVPAVAWAATIFTLLISIFVYTLHEKSLRITSREKGVLILTATFRNVTYLGLPVLTGLYGYRRPYMRSSLL